MPKLSYEQWLKVAKKVRKDNKTPEQPFEKNMNISKNTAEAEIIKDLIKANREIENLKRLLDSPIVDIMEWVLEPDVFNVAFTEYISYLKLHKHSERLKEIRDIVRASKVNRKRIPSKLKETVLTRDRHRCVICLDVDNLELHHVRHRKHNGKDDTSNLITLCLRCHTRQHKDEPVYNLMLNKCKTVYGENFKL